MAKPIMIQGTMSNVGKSLLTAGLCRIFKQDGYKVAPFKSQNMALNSFITEDGLEMGRAQVMQAEAAGIKPSVWMNPVLLKPTNDMESQVIVNGEVLGNMSAANYFEYKKALIPGVMEAYQKLDEEYDIIVIEGAGSPAEINLKTEDDFVNMGMAKLADAPVLLVGDIDKGGVFAQLIGTVDLLDEEERDRVKGLIINKFRGDVSILQPGIKMIEDRANVPVVGVTPYIHVEVDDEDSLSSRLVDKKAKGLIDLAVIRFPRLSNFTDFNPFEMIEGVSLRYVKNPQELGEPDLILLPGTKNTMEDLLWMRQNGLEASIFKLVKNGTPVFGICGGYQMLGRSLKDPEGVEAGGEMAGMGLLPTDTVFTTKKTRTRVKGKFGHVEGIFAGLSGVELEGYEIHMGETKRVEGGKSLTYLETTDTIDGAYENQIYGSYVHGIFDKDQVVKEIIQALGRKKGIDMSNLVEFDLEAFKESQYDILAAEMRKNLDMDKIYEILGYKESKRPEQSHEFFENTKCQYYPCHEGMEVMNCMFCYCPMYRLEHCPGKPEYFEKDGKRIKVCTNCTFPHQPENYSVVMEVLKNQMF